MSQLQKKSFVAAAMGHFLLLAVLIVGPAFFVDRNESADSSKGNANDPIITVLPNEQVEKILSESGRIASAPPSRLPSTEPSISQPPSRNAPKLPRVDISNPVFRNPANNQSSLSGNGNSEAIANREKQIKSALESIRQQFSTESKPGPIISKGNSDVDYANFVEAAYDTAWFPPNDAADEDATVKVSVTVSRTGAVASSQILKRSGVDLLDRSIAGLLDRVKTIGRPFPDGDQEVQRTFIINFNLKTKRHL